MGMADAYIQGGKNWQFRRDPRFLVEWWSRRDILGTGWAVPVLGFW